MFYLFISLFDSLFCITPYTITQLHDTGLCRPVFFYNVITYWYDIAYYRYYTITALRKPRHRYKSVSLNLKNSQTLSLGPIWECLRVSQI